MDFKLVLVDDDPIILSLHKILIERSKLPSLVLSFKNGKEAYDFFSNNAANKIPYLVLLDINMPVMSGWEFLDAIQNLAWNENIFVAMVSSSINSQDIRKAKKIPQVIDYIEKPLQKKVCDELFYKLQKLIKAP